MYNLRMRRILLVVGLLGWSTSLLSCGSPSEPSNSLSGIVTDALSGAGLAGVALSLQTQTATTGADGRYTITGLASGAATLTAKHQGHVNFSQAVTPSGASTFNIPMTPSNAVKTAGNWSGTWVNSTFATTGSVTMTVTIDTTAQSFSLTLNVNGNVFGGPDPAAETFTGNYTTTGATLTRTSLVFGSVTATVTPDGAISGSAVTVPNPNIARLDFTGTITANTLTLNYTVTFTAGGTAVGTATLTK